MLLDEVIEAFIHSRRQGLSGAKCVATEKTIRGYRQWLDTFSAFIRDRREKVKYGDITRNDIRAYVEYVNSQSTWSAATKMSHLRILRTLFNFVEQDEECKELGLKSWLHLLPKVGKMPRKDYIPTPKDLKNLRGAWDTDSLFGLRNYIVFSLVLACGMRIGEVCWLRLEHLQLDNGFIYVPKEGKTGSRLVPVENKMVNLLKHWLRRRKSFTKADEAPWVFLSRGGVQCTPHSIQQAFRKLQPGSDKKRRITPHTLRHSFGTYYLRNGGNMERLRLLMGHTTYDTLRGYLHLAEVGTQQAKEELERVSPLKMVAGK